MMKRIILITGGQRSGKSEEAERLALSLSPHPVYLATAHIWDDEFRERVERHQERRGPQWTNIEEEQWLSRHDVTGRVVLIDCVTLWLTNLWFAGKTENPEIPEAPESPEHPESPDSPENPENPEKLSIQDTLRTAKQEFDRFTAQDATFIFVTNEIGWGGVSENKVQRQFTDLQGWMNQYIAQQADEVILMVSGIPVKIK